MKALIVDDDYRNIFALKVILERGRLEVITAESGEEGLAILQRTPDIDIVLMDIMMPGMDGYETIRAMRKLPAGRGIPIVAVTAVVDDEARQRCLDAGASAYVAKPIETGAFLVVIGEWLRVVAALA